MIFISHRGNISGKSLDFENKPSYINRAIELGFHVEIDVWFEGGEFWLGHDFPQYKTDYKFLVNEKLWCHAKNIEALFEMKKYVIHYFWHENDKVTLTSKNYVWAYPTNNLLKGSIAVIPDYSEYDFSDVRGICSDYVGVYRDNFKK